MDNPHLIQNQNSDPVQVKFGVLPSNLDLHESDQKNIANSNFKSIIQKTKIKKSKVNQRY